MKTFKQYYDTDDNSQLTAMSKIRHKISKPTTFHKSKKKKMLDKEHRKALQNYGDI